MKRNTSRNVWKHGKFNTTRFNCKTDLQHYSKHVYCVSLKNMHLNPDRHWQPQKRIAYRITSLQRFIIHTFRRLYKIVNVLLMVIRIRFKLTYKQLKITSIDRTREKSNINGSPANLHVVDNRTIHIPDRPDLFDNYNQKEFTSNSIFFC